MIRSIYIRVVLTFLGSVIAGTVISFFVSTWIFEDKLNQNAQINLRNFGQDVVQIYKTLPVREADLYVSGMKQAQFLSYPNLRSFRSVRVLRKT